MNITVPPSPKPNNDCKYCQASKRAIERYHDLDKQRHSKFLKLANELREVKKELSNIRHDAVSLCVAICEMGCEQHCPLYRTCKRHNNPKVQVK